MANLVEKKTYLFRMWGWLAGQDVLQWWPKKGSRFCFAHFGHPMGQIPKSSLHGSIKESW